jgi:hypothetical protein
MGTSQFSAFLSPNRHLLSSYSILVPSEYVMYQTALCYNHLNLASCARSIERLPFDHHELAGMIASRWLENPPLDFLGPLSCYGRMKAAHMVYEALGVPDAMGFSQIGSHNHCQFSMSPHLDLIYFIDKYFVGSVLQYYSF